MEQQVKNTLKNRVIAFAVAYVVSFVVARIYRNKVIVPQLMAQQQMMLQYHIRNGNLKVLS